MHLYLQNAVHLTHSNCKSIKTMAWIYLTRQAISLYFRNKEHGGRYQAWKIVLLTSYASYTTSRFSRQELQWAPVSACTQCTLYTTEYTVHCTLMKNYWYHEIVELIARILDTKFRARRNDSWRNCLGIVCLWAQSCVDTNQYDVGNVIFDNLKLVA